jgi:photosystem II stability/assembly factor-like uncharacterized protein
MKRNTSILTLSVIAILAFSGCTAKKSDDASIEFSKSIWKSSDNGKTWEAKNKAENKMRVSDVDILSLVINPYDTNVIYAGLLSGGLIKSVNGGDTWQPTNVIADKVYGLDMDPLDSKILFVSGVWQNRGKVWRTEDSGENWTEIYTEAADGPLVIALLVDRADPRNIYLSTSENQIIKSEDGGNSWKKIMQANSPIVRISMDRSDNRSVYFLTLDGALLRTRDAGETIEDVSGFAGLSGVSFSKVSVMAIDPTRSGGIYVAGENGILRSNDFGTTWSQVNELNDPDSNPITALAINPKNGFEIMYVASSALYKSIDGGQHWSTYQFDTNRRVNLIKYDPLKQGIIYLGFRK